MKPHIRQGWLVSGNQGLVTNEDKEIDFVVLWKALGKVTKPVFGRNINVSAKASKVKNMAMNAS